MPDDPSCQAPHAPTGAVPRTCVPFAHVPAVPVVAVPYVPVPVPSGLPVLSVAGILPDRTGNVDVTRFLEEWAVAPLAGKADKVPSAPAGNLASLDASGNLADSGATPASIKAAAVAEVVANAPAALDTLEEIADILGSAEQTGTVLKRILDLESGKADSSSLARVATSGSYDDLSGKPTIPAAVTVDAALATRGAAADAKVVGDALRGGFTEWVCDEISDGWTFVSCEWDAVLEIGTGWFVTLASGSVTIRGFLGGNADSVNLEKEAQGNNPGVELSRHLITPTKTSQLVNDGAPNGGGTPYATTAQIPVVTGKADKVSGAAAGNLASLTATGNLVDSGAKPSDFAAKADLPYRLVTPGEWEFSDGLNHSISGPSTYGSGRWIYLMDYDYSSNFFDSESAALSALSLTFEIFEQPTITATRASLPGHLLDRAVNAVSDEAALVLPPLENQGKSRDLLVRMTLTSSTTVTVSPTSPETVTWDSAGSPSDTYEAGTYLFRFTEVSQSVFHFTDLGDGGSIDPAVLNGKLEATSAAPAFDSTKTYSVGEYVTYEGVLYECTTAITTAGAWTGSTNWTATDMTTPDATLDLMADGRLRLVSADGEVLWMQGYGLASASSVTLSCDKVNFHAFAAAPAFDATAAYAANDIVAYDGVVYVFTAAHAAGAWTGSDASVYAVALAMPTAPSGKVGDFVLDVDNTANASASVTATLTGAGTAFDVFTPEGVNLSTDILTFAGGEQCELYFTMTAFGTAAKPAWKVVKQIVEKQEFGS